MTVRAAISFAFFFGVPALLEALLDVLVLPLALLRPCLLGHADTSLFQEETTAGAGRVTPASSGGFWTLCSVAYASVSWFTTSMPSL